jgi:hypothetical protein
MLSIVRAASHPDPNPVKHDPGQFVERPSGALGG